MANQFLSLALFLMLLSFFIVMNAVSSFEDHKLQPVMTSLSRAFSGSDVGADTSAVIIDSDPRAVSSKGDTLEVIEGLFNAHISGFKASRNRFGNVMHVRSTVDDFEKAIDLSENNYDQLTNGQSGSFAMSMITILRSDNIGVPYRIDMVMNVPEDPAIFQKESPREFNASLKRVSSFARILEGYGLPQRMMSVAMAKGDAGFIDIYFYRYEAFDVVKEIRKLDGLDER